MNRLSECWHCGAIIVSHPTLKDFTSFPNHPRDQHYCGHCLEEAEPVERDGEEAYDL